MCKHGVINIVCQGLMTGLAIYIMFAFDEPVISLYMFAISAVMASNSTSRARCDESDHNKCKDA